MFFSYPACILIVKAAARPTRLPRPPSNRAPLLGRTSEIGGGYLWRAQIGETFGKSPFLIGESTINGNFQ